MSPPVVVIEPGQRHRVDNVEFVARTADTPPAGTLHGIVNSGVAE